MALKQDYTHNNRTFIDAYIRIDNLTASKIGSNRLEVTIYTGKDCASVIDTMVLSCDIDYDSTQNYNTQAYDYLKTLEAFSDAVDC